MQTKNPQSYKQKKTIRMNCLSKKLQIFKFILPCLFYQLNPEENADFQDPQ